MPMASFRKQQAEASAAVAALEASATAISATTTAAGGSVQAPGASMKGPTGAGASTAGPVKTKKLLTRQAAPAVSTGGPTVNGSESSTHTSHPDTAAPTDQAADSASAGEALLANLTIAAAAQAASLERQSAVTGDGGGSDLEAGLLRGHLHPAGLQRRRVEGQATAVLQLLLLPLWRVWLGWGGMS